MSIFNKKIRFISAIKVRIENRLNKPVLRQEFLLREALKEKGISPKSVDISCNHDLGLNYVNGIEFSIKYPEFFFLKSQKLIKENKKYNFYFNGFINISGQRELLLSPFSKLSNSLIISSNTGRKRKNKSSFNTEYFSYFGESKFGLCPHQVDWEGSKEYMWTYRFIESCFTGAIPILFKKTPLGENFIKGFYYLWDDEVLEKSINEKNFEKEIYENKILSKKRFCFSNSEIEKIKKTIK